MELKSFISQSIKDIFDGVVEAQEYAKQKGGNVNVYQEDCIRRVDYDIAVTASSEKEVKGKAEAKIFVVSANLDGKITTELSTISRIKFTIPIELPNKVWVDKKRRVAHSVLI